MLLDIIQKFKSIAVIGLDKNVGKTTTFNYILHGLKNEAVALTSIGRDGESSDVVTNTYKPRIYIYDSFFVATTKSLLLKSDVTFEIYEQTGINTPMGEVIIAKAKSSGFVELAGPSITKDLADTIESLSKFSNRVLVDGALSRKSLASPSVCDACVLATGGAIDRNFETVIKKTIYTYKLLTLKTLADEIALQLFNSLNERVVAVDKDSNIRKINPKTALGLSSDVLDLVTEDTRFLLLRGAVTDSFFQSLFSRFNKSLSDLTIVVEDGTKVFISENIYDKLNIKNIKLNVLNSINVTCVSYNPTSPYGYTFDSDKFLNELKKEIFVPIINVLERDYFEIS